MSLSRSPTLAQADAIHVNMTQEERDRLTVPQEAIDAMSDPQMVPFWLKPRVAAIGPDIMQARTITGQMQMSGVMASYGSQLGFDANFLRKKGLHTVVMEDTLCERSVRYISPWEIAASQGYHDDLILDSDLKESWKLTGNGISTAHVWLSLHKLHVPLQPESPYQPTGDVTEQIKQLSDHAMKLAKFDATHDDCGWALCEKVHEPSPKRLRTEVEVTATEPFSVPDSASAVGDDGTSTHHFHTAPAFLHLRDPRNFAVEGVDFAGGFIVIMHHEKHWCAFVNTTVDATVADVILKALPHAKPEHFTDFLVGTNRVTWMQMLNCRQVQKLHFCLVFRRPLLWSNPSTFRCA